MNTQTRSNFFDKSLPVVIGLFVLLLVFRTFVFDSLWTDEALSWWVSKDTFDLLISRSSEFQGQSPFYYSILWLTQQLGFSSEFALRFPSIVFLIFSCFFLFKIAEQMFCKRTAWVSLLFFLSFDPVLVSLSARPYSLSLVCTLASIYYFLIWINKSSQQDYVFSLIFLVAAFYGHYLFILSASLHLLAAAISGRLAIDRLKIIVFFIFTAILCFPGLIHLKYLWGNRGELFFLKSPEGLDFLLGAFPSLGLIAVVSGLLAALIAGGNPLPAKARISKDARSLVICLFWAISGPLFFFSISYILNGSLFSPRYFLWSTPAAAILFAYFTSNGRSNKILFWTTGTALLLLFVKAADRNWQIEDWRSAAKYLASQNVDQVFVYSGLIESEKITNRVNSTIESYLNAPLEYYGLTNTTAIGSKFSFDKREFFNSRIVLVANRKFKQDQSQTVGKKLALKLGKEVVQPIPREFGMIEIFE